MSNTAVIKEFLVALGFKVDVVKLKKFDEAIDNATKTVGKLGTALEAMAGLAFAAVNKTAERFESLYYMSKRVGSSVADINAMSYALSQVGGTADQAKGAINALANFANLNYAGAPILKSFGVEAEHVHDGVAALQDLVKRWRTMPLPQATQQAAVLGIDPATLQVLLRLSDKFFQEYRDQLAKSGVDQEDAAEASKDFMQRLRSLMLQIGLLADKITLKLMPVIDGVIGFLKAADEATSGLSSQILILASVLVPLLIILDPIVVAVIALGAALVALWQDFQNWRNGAKSLIDWGEWAPDIDRLMKALAGLMDAFGDLGKLVGGFIQRYFHAFGPYFRDLAHILGDIVVGAIHVLEGAIRVLVDLLRGDWKSAWSDAIKSATDGLGDLIRIAKDAGRAISDALYPVFHHGEPAPGRAPEPSASADARAAALAKTPAKAPPGAAPAANDNAGPAMRGMAEHVRAYFVGHGFSREQAAGITAGAVAENGGLDPHAVNPKSGAYGIGQWLGSRKAELFRRYGKRPTLDNQLDFLIWELNGGDAGGKAVRNAKTSGEALNAYITKFMRPAPGKETVGDLHRGLAHLNSTRLMDSKSAQANAAPAAPAKGVEVNQKTEIHVHGATDAHGTAKRVRYEQDRVNADLLRNTKTALA